MGKYSLKLDIQQFAYRVPVDNTKRCLRDVLHEGTLRHLKYLYSIETSEGETLLEKKTIQVQDAIFDGGLLEIDVEIEKLGLDDGSLISVFYTKETESFLEESYPGVLEKAKISQKLTFERHSSGGTDSEVGLSTDGAVPYRVDSDSLGSATRRELSSFRRYTSTEIIIATKNFAESNLIGSGGQANVYRGSFPGIEIAVKRFGEAFPDAVVKEVEVLTSAPHPHVLLVMGWCPEERCFVSEFMAGGSLNDRLKDKVGAFTPLLWTDRLRIVKEIVSALIHLHKAKIVHRDIKPANILLDDNGKVRIADMALAHTFDRTSLFRAGEMAEERESGGVLGTVGYLDPAYLEEGRIGPEFDVFSLGVIIIQIAMNEPNVGIVRETRQRLLDNFSETVSKCLAPEDGTLERSIMEELIVIGIKSSAKDPKERPSLNDIWLNVQRMSSDNVKQDTSPQSQSGAPLTEKEKSEEQDWKKFLLSIDGQSNNDIPPGVLSQLAENSLTLLSQAEEGNSEEQYFLGRCYRYGFGSFTVDQEKASRWMFMASKGGNSEATKELNEFYDSQYDAIKKSSVISVQIRRESLENLQRGAKLGIPRAQLRLGEALNGGIWGEKDIFSAIEWLSKAWIGGEPGAKEKLQEALKEAEKALFSPHSTPKVRQMAEKVEAVASQGFPPAQLLIGQCFLRGAGGLFPMDLGMAFKWIQGALRGGEEGAQGELQGICVTLYRTVSNPPDNLSKKDSLKFLRNISVQGHLEAMYFLSLIYYSEPSLDTKNEMSKWLSLASEKGHVLAQWSFALYLQYNGNAELAKSWRQRSKSNLGDLEKVLRFSPFPPEKVQTSNSLVQGAQSGIREAQILLGKCYLKGWSFPVNYSLAYKWLKNPNLEEESSEAVEVLDSHFDKFFKHLKKLSLRKITSKKSEALKELEKGAHAGIPVAQFKLSECFKLGLGVKQDANLAFQWYNSALSNGYISAPQEDNSHGGKDFVGKKFDAQNMLSKLYLTGTGPYCLDKPTFDWLKEKCSEGDEKAKEQLEALSVYIYETINSSKVKPEAVAHLVCLLVELISLGSVEANFRLGLLHKDGTGVEKDKNKSIEYLEKAAEKDHLLSLWELLLLSEEETKSRFWQERAQGKIAELERVLKNETNPENLELTLKILEENAQKGNSLIQLHLGKFYSTGGKLLFPPPNYQKSFELLKLSKENGHGEEAEKALDDLFRTLFNALKSQETSKYSQGTTFSLSKLTKSTFRGVCSTVMASTSLMTSKVGTKSTPKLELISPIEVLENASSEGDFPEATFYLGECYFHGYGVDQSFSKAMELFLESSEKGHVKSEFRMGSIYESGLGVPESNLESAFKWYSSASQKGFEDAQTRLAVFHQLGLSVPVDEKVAADLFSQAAEKKGQSEAQWRLGLCYENGLGVERDPKKALDWISRAAQQSHLEAFEGMKKRIVAYPTSTSYEWGIQQVTLLAANEAVFSPPFAAHGVYWKLSYCSKGTNGHNNHVSLHLSLAYPFQLYADWSTSVHFTITLVNRKDKSRSRISEGYERFSRSQVRWGNNHHTPISMVNDPEQGFLLEDTLIVEVIVRV